MKVQLDKFSSNTLHARRKEFHIGGAEIRCERSEQKWGSGGLPPRKFFMTTPFRSLENAPFLENVPLAEAKITTNESLSLKILKSLTSMTSKDIPF